MGANAFAHESGIHQDGMLKNRETYEIMTPERVGVSKTSLVMGKHSGRNAFFSRLEEIGLTGFSEEHKKELFAKFKALADQKKVVTDGDLHALVQEGDVMQATVSERYRLQDFKLNANMSDDAQATSDVASATVRILEVETESSKADAATGNGPIDAICNAINRITGLSNVRMTHFEVKSVLSSEEASDSMGECVLRLKDETTGVIVTGRGLDVNVLKSAALAYVNAVNKLSAAAPPSPKAAQLKAEAI